MAELWGFQAGQQQAQQYTQNQALFNLAQAEGGMKLQEDAVSLETQKLGLAQQEMMLNLLKNRATSRQTKAATSSAQSGGALPGTGPNMDELAEKADEDGDILAATGKLNEASESYERASSIRKNSAEISKNQAEQNMKDIGTLASILEDGKAQIAAGADPQKVWQEGNLKYMAVTGRESSVAHMPYSPELLDAVERGAQTMQQRAATQAEQARTKAEVAAAADAKARAPLIAAQTRVAQERADNLAKAGTVPNKAMLDAAKHYINENFNVDPDNLDIYAGPVAEDAERLMRQNHMAQSEAVATAYRNAERAKSFAKLPSKEFNTTAAGAKGGGFGGGWAQAQYQRTITAGNEALKEIGNIMELPATTNVGWLSSTPGTGVLGTTKSMLLREVSGQDVQSYGAMAAGIQRFAATVEASGVATGIQHFADQMGPQIVLQKGDTVQTKLLKMG